LGDDLITSLSNESIKRIKKLKDRKNREATATAFVEGTRQVVEAIRKNALIEKIIYTEAFLSSIADKSIGEIILGCDASQMLVSEEVFKSFSVKEGPQGVAAVVHQKWTRISEYSGDFSGVWVCLWEIADPGNLGTILRTMDAVGATGLILAGNCTDPYDPTSLRASMGGIFGKTLVKSKLEELVDTIKNRSIKAFGTSDSAEVYYRDILFPNDMFLVMGSERQGIPDQIMELCIEKVNIPMQGDCDSLNLAVATGVLLYEILDQHLINSGKN